MKSFNSRKIFFKKFIQSPRSIGSVIPSTKFLAKKMCEVIKAMPKSSIVEIGAGTGAITETIAFLMPDLVEIDKELAEILEYKFPHLSVYNYCAIEHLKKINTPVGVVFSVPLINNPQKKDFIEVIDRKYNEGFIKWCVLYSYGKSNPFQSVCFKEHQLWRRVYFNIPPAVIWVYK